MRTATPGHASVKLAVAALLFAAPALAQSSDEAKERCAVRVSIAILGQSPSQELLSASSPKDLVDQYLSSPTFIERFARFVNQRFNNDPGTTPGQDAAYYLSKEVLTRNLPWRELFGGQWQVVEDTGGAHVAIDPDGLGYFRSPVWLRRYAGNEPQGYKLSTAYRIMNNVIGLKLVAATNAADVDISTEGRKAATCSGCHWEGPFALDKVARVLTRREGTGDSMTFVPSTEAPQQILGDLTIHDDKELVNALLDSEDFRFNTCRLVFQYLYGRAERTCEGPVFDRCVDAFAQWGTVQSAIAAVVKDDSFCQ